MRKVCHQFNRVNPVLNTAANSIMLGKSEKIIKKQRKRRPRPIQDDSSNPELFFSVTVISPVA